MSNSGFFQAALGFIKYVKIPPLKAEAIIEIIVIQSIINV
nr:MAG TPA: hypothetical protein [Crassvirales sp.]